MREKKSTCHYISCQITPVEPDTLGELAQICDSYPFAYTRRRVSDFYRCRAHLSTARFVTIFFYFIYFATCSIRSQISRIGMKEQFRKVLLAYQFNPFTVFYGSCFELIMFISIQKLFDFSMNFFNFNKKGRSCSNTQILPHSYYILLKESIL